MQSNYKVVYWLLIPICKCVMHDDVPFNLSSVIGGKKSCWLFYNKMQINGVLFNSYKGKMTFGMKLIWAHKFEFKVKFNMHKLKHRMINANWNQKWCTYNITIDTNSHDLSQLKLWNNHHFPPYSLLSNYESYYFASPSLPHMELD
jgi:hypothetical protein